MFKTIAQSIRQRILSGNSCPGDNQIFFLQPIGYYASLGLSSWERRRIVLGDELSAIHKTNSIPRQAKTARDWT